MRPTYEAEDLRVHRPSPYAALVVGLAIVLPAATRSEPATDLTALLTRVGQRVEQYYVRAQSIVARETVRIQPLGPDLSPVGFGRRLDLASERWRATFNMGRCRDESARDGARLLRQRSFDRVGLQHKSWI